ncbi:MAG: glycerate kinase, partial [Bacteroidales bacterium]|nr:glycerate kinase [Bacteroidales bacterium]
MKILLAPDSFKGCLTAREVADTLADGLRSVRPACATVHIPVADGGEGFCEAILSARGGEWVHADTVDPLGRPLRARYALCGDTAVVETAAASGLPLLRPAERNPLQTSSYGTGLLIRDALERGCREFLIGLGGSATHDAGTGLLSALGFRFLDASGQVLPGCGASLGRIAAIDRSAAHPALAAAHFTAACDVDTPFCGPGGAAEVFAPQKGATPEQVRLLDEGTASFAEVMRQEILRCAQDDKRIVRDDKRIVRDDKRIVRDDDNTVEDDGKGYGAAGGIGGALHALLGARLSSGIDLVLAAAVYDAQLRDAALVITGEGRLDGQTARGKA